MAKEKTTHKNVEGPRGKDGQHEGRDGKFQPRYVNDKKEMKMLDIKNTVSGIKNYLMDSRVKWEKQSR